MGEHLPCKQGVKSSNLSISIEVAKQLLKFEVPMHDKRLYLENFIQKEILINNEHCRKNRDDNCKLACKVAFM